MLNLCVPTYSTGNIISKYMHNISKTSRENIVLFVTKNIYIFPGNDEHYRVVNRSGRGQLKFLRSTKMRILSVLLIRFERVFFLFWVKHPRNPA